MKNSDYIGLNLDESGDAETGFLKLLARVTRTGVFVYNRVLPDGTVETLRQLRHPDDVFEEESLKTLIGLPITNTHPNEPVTAENSSDYIVGMSSDVPKRI